MVWRKIGSKTSKTKIQALTDAASKRVDELGVKKEADIMTI